jgi:phage tail-like protein
MSFGETRKLHEKWKFIVETTRFGFSAFQKCSELSVEAAKVEYFEGGANIPIKDAGRLTFSDVTLDRGSSNDFEFHKWFLDVVDASKDFGGTGAVSPNYKADDVAIIQRDRDNSKLREWQLIGAWPMKYVAGDWDNTADEVVIEQATLTYDYFFSPDA